MATPAVQEAARLADEVLFPAAPAVDLAARVPPSHLEALAAAGLYGAAVPVEQGGLGLSGADHCRVVEHLASGCLATTFVWLQHHSLVRSLAAGGGDDGLRRRWLGPLCAGRTRAGIALGGLLPGPPRLTARRRDGGWLLDGHSPWVTGWGLVDVLQVAARGPDDACVWLAVEPTAGGLRAERQRLVAVDASSTVSLAFEGVAVDDGALVRLEPYEQAAAEYAANLRANGSLALGVARRCCRIVGPGPLDDDLDRCREALDRASPAAMPSARAAASALAHRAAGAAVARSGSGSLLAGHHAQRLAREALFLLVFGSRPAIRQDLLARLGAASGPDPIPA
ncbi:MAG TPA: acyl-CoA dehydrogenase family protein [Acidimicrobiales bacterium]|nr:acyl-CoA dehydrogenase family protein [Acidimicrobiales bacterium]